MSKAMTIGQMIDELEQYPTEWRCQFGPLDLRWDGVHSWRGIYAEPACGYTTEYREVTVGNVLGDLRALASGQCYTGWKGGEWSYGRGHVLHVAQPDECGRAFVGSVSSPWEGFVVLSIVVDDDE